MKKKKNLQSKLPFVLMSYAIQVIMIKAFSINQFARAILFKVLFSFRSTFNNCSKPCSEFELLVPWHFWNIPQQFSCHLHFDVLHCIFNGFYCSALLPIQKMYNVLVLKATWFSHVGKMQDNCCHCFLSNSKWQISPNHLGLLGTNP